MNPTQGFRIRLATPADTPAMARVRVDTWRVAYAGIVPQEVLDDQSYARTEQAWRAIWDGPGKFTLVGESAEGEVVGILIAGPERGYLPQYAGEIYVIYILPDYQGAGLGRRLVAEAARRLIADGRRSLVLWVLQENAPARRFYERLGGKLAGEKPITLGEHTLMEVAYGWEDAGGLVI